MIRELLLLLTLASVSVSQYAFQFQSTGNTQFATDVSAGGDVDGDGITDYAVTDGSSLHVFSGATGTLQYSVPGLALNRVHADFIGDVDGDGTEDLATGGWAPGQLNVVDGATGTATLLLTTPGIGDGIERLGDVDGDGVPEFLTSIAGGWNAFVVSAATGAIVHTLPASQSPCYTRIDDVNADGVPDVVVGNVGPPNIRIFSGLDASVLLTIAGDAQSIAAVDDLDGDGLRDIIAGDGMSTVSGRAKVFSSATGNILWSAVGLGSGDIFGHAVADAGDADGNGTGDLAVSSRGFDARVDVFSGATGSLLYTHAQFAAIANDGGSLAGNHDINGDGVPDLVAGSRGGYVGPGMPNPGPVAGTAEVLSPVPALAPVAAGALGMDLLTIDGSAGAVARRVDVAVGSTFTMAVAATPGSPHGLFAVFGTLGVPDAASAVVLPQGVGSMAFTPCVFAPGDPTLFTLTSSFLPFGCAPLLPAATSPWNAVALGGLPFPLDVTLQLVAPSPSGTMRTANAVIVSVR